MAWIDKLLEIMVEEEASDLHLSSQERPFFRLHGEMAPVANFPDELNPLELDTHLAEITPSRNQEEFAQTWDSDFAYELAGVGRFRVNLFYDRNGAGAVLRHIPQDIPTADKLRLPRAILDFCELSKGLVLVTGPTGSGKSTTLAAMIDHINRRRKEHIITIEDPIEFVHPNRGCLVNQREVHRHTGSFKRALRAALREDPDIVLVGEMRDLETIEIAIETAETGHLVFGTLHTTTAASTVDRIIDQFPADRQAQIRTMLSSSLKGVVAQTLCKKVGGGRVAAQEILVVTNAVSSLVREGKTYQIASNMQVSAKYGSVLLNDALVKLAKDGLVDPLEAYNRSVDKREMRERLRAAGMMVEGIAVDDEDGAARRQQAPAASARPEPAAPAASPAASDPGSGGYVDPFEEFRRRKKP